jgi:uncharacterized protein (TIGR00369 family)
MTPAEIQRVVREGVPLGRAWGVEVLSVGEGVATLRLPHHEDLLRPGGTVSGPALMGLADMAMWAALLSLTGGRDESLTANLSITFLRAPAPRAVIAEARVIKKGRTLSYGEVLLRSEGEEAPCAHVTTSWAAARRPA